MNVVPGYIVSCNYGEKVSRVIEGIVESEAAFVFLHSVDEGSVGNKSEYKGIQGNKCTNGLGREGIKRNSGFRLTLLGGSYCETSSLRLLV